MPTFVLRLMLFEALKVCHVATILEGRLAAHSSQSPYEAVKGLIFFKDFLDDLGASEDTYSILEMRDIPLKVKGGGFVSFDFQFPYFFDWEKTSVPLNLLQEASVRFDSASTRRKTDCSEEELNFGTIPDLGRPFELRAFQRYWYFEGSILYINRACRSVDDFQYIRMRVEEFVYEQRDSYLRLVNKVERLRQLGSIGGVRSRGSIPDDILAFVLERDNEQCVVCSSRSELQFDHVLPFSRGGSDEPENLRVLCRTCNARRGNLR